MDRLQWELFIEESLMPLARIDIPAGKSADYRSAIGQVVYDAMTSTPNVPKDDRFQIITEHSDRGEEGERVLLQWRGSIRLMTGKWPLGSVAVGLQSNQWFERISSSSSSHCRAFLNQTPWIPSSRAASIFGLLSSTNTVCAATRP